MKSLFIQKFVISIRQEMENITGATDKKVKKTKKIDQLFCVLDPLPDKDPVEAGTLWTGPRSGPMTVSQFFDLSLYK